MMHHKYSSNSLDLDLYEGLPSFHRGLDNLAEDIGDMSLWVVKRNKREWSQIASTIGRMMAINEAVGADLKVSETLEDHSNRTAIEVLKGLRKLLDPRVLLSSFGSEDEFVKYVQKNESELKPLIGFQTYNATGLRLISKFRSMFFNQYALKILVTALDEDFEWNEEEYAWSIDVEDEVTRLFKKYTKNFLRRVVGSTTDERMESVKGLIEDAFKDALADPTLNAVSEEVKASIKEKFSQKVLYAMRDVIVVDTVTEDSPLVAQFFEYMIKFNVGIFDSISGFSTEVGETQQVISKVIWSSLAEYISSSPKNLAKFKKWLKTVVRYNISQIDNSEAEAGLTRAVHDHYANTSKGKLPATIFEEAENAYRLFIGRKSNQATKSILKGKLGSEFLEGTLRREPKINEVVSDVYEYAKEELMRAFRFKAYVEDIGELISDKPKYNTERLYEEFMAELSIEGIY